METMKRFFSILWAAAFGAVLIELSAASAAQAPQLTSVDAGEISTGYAYLTDNFYKKVDAQVVLDSVRAQLLSAMRTGGVRHADLPVVHASMSVSTNVRAIDREIESADVQSKGKFKLHDLTYIALDGMMKSVNDRYTVFMTPKEFAGLNQGLDGGDFGGTGIVIQVDDGTKYIAVQNVIPDGPADKAGIEQDDLITNIDGASTKGMTVQQASTKLRGKEGTNVTLGISRDGSTVTPITITR